MLLLGIWIGKSLHTVSFLKETDGFPSAAVLEVPVPLPEFQLTDHNGKEFTPSNFSGKWTFMFFGYIYCPDICPAALIDLNDIYQNLVENNDLIENKFKIGTQVIFVTVDPQRDSPEDLKKYVPFFNNSFIGLTGTSEMIDLLARPLGVVYRRESNNNSIDYFIDHSASFLLIDPLGRLRAIFSPPHEPVQIAEDFRMIRKKFTAECCIPGNKKFETGNLDHKEGEK